MSILRLTRCVPTPDAAIWFGVGRRVTVAPLPISRATWKLWVDWYRANVLTIIDWPGLRAKCDLRRFPQSSTPKNRRIVTNDLDRGCRQRKMESCVVASVTTR
jgi:hypothetical protein